MPLAVSGGFDAILASPAGQPVEVRLALAAERIELTVTDHGAGISAAVLSRLFEPGGSSRPGGSGLGLAISHLLARHIGAGIRLLHTGPAGPAFAVTLGRVADGADENDWEYENEKAWGWSAPSLAPIAGDEDDALEGRPPCRPFRSRMETSARTEPGPPACSDVGVVAGES